MSKITLATFKSFVNKNMDKLLISNRSDFDGMVDGVRDCENKSFRQATPNASFSPYTLGINGIWLVRGSRNYFTAYSQDGMNGIEVTNSCGTFIVAIQTAPILKLVE
jgi:hypothetical protein